MPTAASTSLSATQPSPTPPNPAATSTDLQPWRPSATDRWDRRKAAHLLRRAGFGYKPEELDTIVKLGMDRTVDLLLSPLWMISQLGRGFDAEQPCGLDINWLVEEHEDHHHVWRVQAQPDMVGSRARERHGAIDEGARSIE